MGGDDGAIPPAPGQDGASAPPSSGDAAVGANATDAPASLDATGALSSGFSVLTNRYDDARSGVNLTEKVLTASNVNTTNFHLLFSQAVDGQIYAQPLYLSHLTMADGSVHDVVFVATEHNVVDAFDAAETRSSVPLWETSLGPSGPSTSGPIQCDNLAPAVGITATPVIDPVAGVLYVASKTYTGTSWAQMLHALNVASGKELPGSPIRITASVKGTASDAVGGIVSFDPTYQLGRAGMLLENGIVYAAFASHCDIQPYHGWVLGYSYDGKKFTQARVFNVTPNGSEGGIWQGGVGLSSDGTSLFLAAGNGSTNPTATPPDLSESVIRLALSDFSVQDYWTPTAYVSLNRADSDLSTGAILLPHNLLLTGSKAGALYVLNSTNLGKYSKSGDQILQTLVTPGKAAGLNGHLHGGPIYYDLPNGAGERVYLWPEDSQLIEYGMDPTTHLLTTNASGGPLAQGGFAAVLPGHPGGIMTLSANGNAAGTAILWASTPKDPGNGAWHVLDTGVLYAVDAADITHVLWKADPLTLDNGTLADVAKFNSPVVANGRVFVATFSNALNVYGLP